MRAVRLFLYALVGVLLGAVSVLSYAQTQPATETFTAKVTTYRTTNINNQQWVYGDTPAAACTNWVSQAGCTNQVNGNNCGWKMNGPPNCTTGGWTPITAVTGQCPAGYTDNGANCKKLTCPDSTWTLSGSTCTKIDTCAANAGVEKSRNFYTFVPPDKPWGTFCSGGCKLYVIGPIAHPDGSFETYIGHSGQITDYGKEQWAGEACTGAVNGDPTAAPPPTSNPPDKVPYSPPKKPTCAANEGVMTTSGGKVICVPEGTPSAEKPAVAKEKKTETFSDGSSKTTETTKTTAPATGASATTVTTTSTGGQSGAAGTSTSGTDVSKDSTPTDPSKKSEDDTCDPAKDMCGSPGTGGLYEKKGATVSGVLTTFSNGVKASPAGAAMTGFFTVSTPGGSCPNWQVNVPVVDVTLNLSQYFCTAEAMNMMNLVGVVLLAVASFVGFRWAIL